MIMLIILIVIIDFLMTIIMVMITMVAGMNYKLQKKKNIVMNNHSDDKYCFCYYF